MTQYEMVEKLAEKINVTLEEAKSALEAAEWDMLDAALVLEKEHGTTAQTESDQSCPIRPPSLSFRKLKA